MEEMSCRPQRPHFSTAVMRDARCEQSTRLLPRAGRQGEEQRLRARSADPVRGAPGRAATGFPSGSLILAVGSAVIANHQPAASPAATGGRGRLAHLRHHLRVRDGRSPDRKSCDGADVKPPPPPLCCAVRAGSRRRMDAGRSGPVGREGAPPSVGGTSDRCRGQGCRAAGQRAAQFHTPLCVFEIASPEEVVARRNRVAARARDPRRSGFIWVAAVGSHLGSWGCFVFFPLLEGE